MVLDLVILCLNLVICLIICLMVSKYYLKWAFSRLATYQWHSTPPCYRFRCIFQFLFEAVFHWKSRAPLWGEQYRYDKKGERKYCPSGCDWSDGKAEWEMHNVCFLMIALFAKIVVIYCESKHKCRGCALWLFYNEWAVFQKNPLITFHNAFQLWPIFFTLIIYFSLNIHFWYTHFGSCKFLTF